MKAFACGISATGAFFVVSAVYAQTPLRLAALTVDPVQITLSHQHDEQRLRRHGKLSDETLRDLTHSAKYTSADPKIAIVTPRRLVRPVASAKRKSKSRPANKNDPLPSS